MALLSLVNIEKAFGPRAILKGLSLSIDRGDRLGLIGRNGCGKSTLFNIITGREEADRGEVHFARDLKVAWLDQDPKLDTDLTVMQQARKALADLDELEAKLAAWHQKIADAPGHELNKSDHEAMARDEAAFLALAGEDRERMLGIALEKLGLRGELLERKCGQLSGGERTRLALAQFLVAPFDLLILDEPTNHLDIDAIEWLQSALLQAAKTFIVVSHDRAFLDAVCGKVAEIDDGKVTVITGNYTQFVMVKADRLKALERKAELEQNFLEKEMEFIRRHINSQRTREAKGRLKRLVRREAIEVPDEQRAFQLKLRGGSTHADVVLSVEKLGKDMGDRTLFSGLSFELLRGEKLGIVGPNGAGKTTLIKVLLGQLPPSSGRLRLAPQLNVGTFTQDLSHLNPTRTVLEEYARHANPANLNAARAPLGAYLFSGARVEQKVGSLSGGEKARLALCILVSKDCDVLVLDEPTNHLDIPSRQALEASLSVYKGTCLIVSHDRFFLDRVSDKTLWIAGDASKVYLGAYTEAREIRDEEMRPEMEAQELQRAEAKVEKNEQSSAGAPKQKKINEYKLGAIEREIGELEAKKEKLNASLYDEAVYKDGSKARQVTAELESIEAKLLTLNKDWEEVIDAAG